MSDSGRRFAADTVMAKTYLDDERANRPLSVPIHRATIFSAPDAVTHGRLFQRGADTFYQRFGHPTLGAAAEKIAALEDAEAALVFPSGMAAITTALLTVLQTGDHVVCQERMFEQTSRFMDYLAERFGVRLSRVDTSDPGRVADAIEAHTRLIYVETPSNPFLQIADISAIARLARAAKAFLFVDGTFAPPCLQQPLAHGASLSLHSGTKFLGGHMDVMCGSAAGDAALIRRIAELQVLNGAVLDPQAAWLLLRGIKTLGVRMRRICETAARIATFLQSQSLIERVEYPYLAGSPQMSVARRQMSGGGGVVSFILRSGLDDARTLLNHLRLVSIASSLGGVETVIEIPAELDWHKGAGPHSMPPGLIRLSVGLEDAEDLIQDLRLALGGVLKSRATAAL